MIHIILTFCISILGTFALQANWQCKIPRSGQALQTNQLGWDSRAVAESICGTNNVTES